MPVIPLTDATPGQFLPFTDAQVWRDTARAFVQNEEPLLYDVVTDPHQQSAVSDPDVERQMRRHIVDELERLEAPVRHFERFDLRR